MIMPIIAYGDPVLKKKAAEISKDHPNLKELIANMYDTMYKSSGVGLAAPQIGQSLRLFITDGKPFEDEGDEVRKFKQVFINPIITKEEGEKWQFNEGCLSIPGIREDVSRKPIINITYYDENFKKHQETYSGIPARIIQHEYDHLDGILFIDYLSVLKKRLIQNKLRDISKGKVDVSYRMKFPVKR